MLKAGIGQGDSVLLKGGGGLLIKQIPGISENFIRTQCSAVEKENRNQTIYVMMTINIENIIY